MQWRDLIHAGEELEAGERRRGWWLAAAFVAFVVALWLWPHLPASDWTLCPFRALTGYSCPGCGMTRASILVAHGDLAHAVEYHPFAPALFAGFFLVAAHRLAQNLVGRRVVVGPAGWWGRTTNPVLLGSLAFLVVFGLVRLGLELAGFLTPI